MLQVPKLFLDAGAKADAVVGAGVGAAGETPGGVEVVLGAGAVW
jgi:hypothetical protein